MESGVTRQKERCELTMKRSTCNGTRVDKNGDNMRKQHRDIYYTPILEEKHIKNAMTDGKIRSKYIGACVVSLPYFCGQLSYCAGGHPTVP
ncbi:hypothetical protein STEG23_030502 [Scotinomys teguina]